MGYIYKIEYYSAVKKNDILKFAFKWMELEKKKKKKKILSKVTQTQRG